MERERKGQAIAVRLVVVGVIGAVGSAVGLWGPTAGILVISVAFFVIGLAALMEKG